MWLPSVPVFLFFSSVGARVVKSRPAEIHGDSTAQEGNDWLDVMWTFVTGLVAPDEEEEGIHQLTETLTCKKMSHTHPNVQHEFLKTRLLNTKLGCFYYFLSYFSECLLAVEEFSPFRIKDQSDVA